MVQTDEHHVPTYAHRARAVLLPQVVSDIRQVLDLEARARRLRGEPNRDPAQLPGGLPGQIEKARWLAARDLSARVPLELVPTAEPQVARDRKEPPRDAPGTGNGIPDILDGGGVRAGCDHDPRGTALVITGCDLALGGANLADDVDLHDGLLGLGGLAAFGPMRPTPTMTVAAYISQHLFLRMAAKEDSRIMTTPTVAPLYRSPSKVATHSPWRALAT